MGVIYSKNNLRHEWIKSESHYIVMPTECEYSLKKIKQKLGEEYDLGETASYCSNKYILGHDWQNIRRPTR